MVRLFFIQSIFVLFSANIRIFSHICEGEKENREGEKKNRLHDSGQTPSRLYNTSQIQIAELDFIVENHEEAMMCFVVNALPHLIPDVQSLLIIPLQVEHMNLVRIALCPFIARIAGQDMIGGYHHIIECLQPLRFPIWAIDVTLDIYLNFT
jgi:hypothetical protein